VIFSLEEVLKATGGRLIQGGAAVFFQGVSTDSRTLKGGELFVALRGDRFDGHNYAMEALAKNAKGVLIEEGKIGDSHWDGFRSRAVVAVKDSLQALGDIARSRRRKWETPVVAVTGSNGKTTTKDMISACLETGFPVLKTKGNLNNLIGLPMTLLDLTEKEKVVVLEMGMNVPGEIRKLTEIAEPDVGLITNIQMVHLEGMGSLETLKEEKGELFRRMRQDGTIVVNQDDPRVVELSNEFPGRKITFGLEGYADVMATGIRPLGSRGISFTVASGGQEAEMTLPLVGRHFVPNALSAFAVATLFGVAWDNIKGALERFQPTPMRMEVWRLEGGKTVINDAYNANPRSMEVALGTLSELKGKGRAIAVLGDMLELGDYSESAHRQLGQKVRDLSIDFLIAMGEKASSVVESAVRHGLDRQRAKVATSHSEAISILEGWLQEGDWILVKGSRRMAMEKIAEGLALLYKTRRGDAET
jgi:UDP-N-acetylmuramoyl-tripeptide--D-alanyl-D-alanine ligase